MIAYEDDCLDYLHQRCILKKMTRQPIRGLLLELILASNGAVLSDRALVMIGQLAKHHHFGIVVDEIMTGGRTGHLLLTLTKPNDFVSSVTHITMGKWMQVGIVLVSTRQKEMYKERLSGMTARGSSTYIDLREAVSNFQEAFDNLEKTEDRRAQVLDRLGVNESDAWGEGILIFAPVMRLGALQGLKFRLLPMLNGPRIGTIRKKNMTSDWCKEVVNRTVMSGVRSWLDFSSTTSKKEGELLVVAKAISKCKVNQICTSQWFRENYFAKDH